jgi:CheY-like chemotaxis protein
MYRLKLELDGYWVRTIDLDSAVATARARRPDIIFLDLPAGEMDRLEILRTPARRCAGLTCPRSCWPGRVARSWCARGLSLVPPTSW